MGQPIFPTTKKEAEKQGIHYSSEGNRKALFPSRLRELRERKGVSQAVLSAELGVSKSTVGLYETGDTLPDARTLRGIVEYFNISADWLLGISNDRNRMPSAVDELGLTEDAIDVLLDMDDSIKPTLSLLIEQERYVGRDNEDPADKIYGMSYLLKPSFHILKRIADYFSIPDATPQECYITDKGFILSEFELDRAIDEDGISFDSERLIPVETSHLVNDVFLSDIRSMLLRLKEEYQKREAQQKEK